MSLKLASSAIANLGGKFVWFGLVQWPKPVSLHSQVQGCLPAKPRNSIAGFSSALGFESEPSSSSSLPLEGLTDPRPQCYHILFEKLLLHSEMLGENLEPIQDPKAGHKLDD